MCSYTLLARYGISRKLDKTGSIATMITRSYNGGFFSLWDDLKELVYLHVVTPQTDLVARLQAACTSENTALQRLCTHSFPSVFNAASMCTAKPGRLRQLSNSHTFIYLSYPRAWFLDHLTPNLPVLTESIVSRVFIDSSALEQVVTIHHGMAAEWAGLVSCKVKPVDIYFQKVMSGA
ncbi:uncharacterized protein TNCV_3386021 [Trichonephila clavipes]|nr:uncharacterized protein TNCV_3386021 [Trichonephila clavipes]